LCLGALAAFPLAARAEEARWLGPVEAIRIAVDAYIYGYSLVTFEMVRRQQTNVAAPDAEHAPMGQMIKMRSYPAVDNHCCAVPNADTLYTEAWLDVSKEPWIVTIPEMGGRHLYDGQQNPDVRHHRSGLVGRAPEGRDPGQVSYRDGVDPWARL
jgi:hypothetical protein